MHIIILIICVKISTQMLEGKVLNLFQLLSLCPLPTNVLNTQKFKKVIYKSYV